MPLAPPVAETIHLREAQQNRCSECTQHQAPHYQCKPDTIPGCADKIKPAMEWAIDTGAEIL